MGGTGWDPPLEKICYVVFDGSPQTNIKTYEAVSQHLKATTISDFAWAGGKTRPGLARLEWALRQTSRLCSPGWHKSPKQPAIQINVISLMLIIIQYNNPSELRVLGAQAMLEYRSLAFRLKFNTYSVHTYVCRSFLSTSLLDILFITIVFTNQIFPKKMPTIMKTFTATSTSSLASPASRTSSSTCGIGRHHHHSYQHSDRRLGHHRWDAQDTVTGGALEDLLRGMSS